MVCGHQLDSPRRGDSNRYPGHMILCRTDGDYGKNTLTIWSNEKSYISMELSCKGTRNVFIPAKATILMTSSSLGLYFTILICSWVSFTASDE